MQFNIRKEASCNALYTDLKKLDKKNIGYLNIPIISFRLLILVLIYFALSIQVNPQKSNLSFQHFGIEQGMSSTIIGAIYQDRTGYIWFTTSEGLDRYDGYNFTSYKYPKKDKVVDYFYPKTICEDKEGNFWIASLNGGIEKFNPETRTFKNYLPDPQQPEIEWCNIVIAIYIDKNEVIWVGTGNGFYKFNKNSETFASFKYDENDPHSLSHNSVNGIYEDRSGELWLATGGGLDRFDRETNKFFHYWHYANNQWGALKTKKYWVLSITEDDEGIFWLGTDGGLLKFDKKTKDYTLYEHNPNTSTGPSQNTIWSLCDDGAGCIWLSTLQGLDVFNKKTKTFLNYSHNENNPGSLSNNTVGAVYFDRAGSIWIGTDGGINKLDYPNSPFKKYISNTHYKSGLSTKNLFDLYEDNNGTIWIGTNKGLKIFDSYNEAIIPDVNFNNAGIGHDRSGNFYFVPLAGGLYKLNNSNQWTCIIDSNIAIYPEVVRSFYEGANGCYWFGNVIGDFYSFYPSSGEIKLITNIKKTVWTIYEDTYGLVWFGGYSTGLFCFDPIKDSVIEYNPILHDPSSLIDNSFFSFYEDKNRTLWLGCGTGLVKFNRTKNNFTRYYGNNGFLNNWVRKILEDKHGNLWLSTGNGITKFNPSRGHFKDYYSTSYFHEIKFTPLVGIRASNGEMYFGGENGFIRFHPDSIKDDASVPPIVITSFKKFEKEYPFGNEMELAHSDNFISFEFAALSYINSQENQYAYKMEGIDNDWVYSGTRRFASYPNMQPGEYVFRVKGSTSNRVWNETGASIKIVILPPWWQTIWAYIFYVLFIAGIIYSIWKAQLKRIRIKNDFEMSRFEAQKLHEVDKVKTRFFTNISHEFRTPLTLIQGPAKQIIEKTNEPDTRDSANFIYRNSQKLIRLVNQLLDLSKLEAGEMNIRASETDIITFLKEIVLSFTTFAEKKNITLKFINDEEHIIVYLDRDKMYKIVNNVLSNAFKFTPEGGSVDVVVHCQAELVSASSFAPKIPKQVRNDDRGFVEISIRDTGIGIPKDRIDKIFDRFYQVDDTHTREQEGTGIGLALTKELVDLHKGKDKSRK